MNEFSTQLRQLAARLQIPEPARTRVLLEIATDMEDMLQHHLDGGMTRAAAVSAVEEQFDLSEEALRELVEVHSSPFQSSLESLSGQARSPWERMVLAVVAVVVAAGLVTQLFQPGLFGAAGPLAFALLSVLALALGVGFWKAADLFGRRSRLRSSVPRQAVRSLPGLALLLLGMGFAGVWVQLYRSALQIRARPGMAMVHLVEWLHSSSATLVVALSGALLTGILWFSLEARAALLEEQAASRFMKSKEGN